MGQSMKPEGKRQRTGAKSVVSEMEVLLAPLDWRLLRWLLHYPLQRADDLVIGVARWTSRATVYRHLDHLQQRRLIESVLPQAPGDGKRLYYLSNLGLHVLASYLGTPAAALADTWQAGEAGLLHLLPRLPALLVIQDVVNGLIVHAADAMTIQGRRARLVRWTWQRDLTRQFVSREQTVRFFADGALALCIRAPQADGSVCDRWYSLFLLSTELDDERLMRLRLERLLRWRESAERWTHYQHMPLVLILARSVRQREHWQRAIDITALKLRLDPLAGALACLPPHETAGANSWQFGWRTLSTDVSCHLQDLLVPLPRTVVSTLLPGIEDETEAAHKEVSTAGKLSSLPFPPSTRRSRIIVGNLHERKSHIAYSATDERTKRALLGLHLTSTEWNVLYLLLAHPLLSDAELAVFLKMQRQSVRCSLYALHRLGCCEAISTAVGKRWHLCERGLQVLAAANHLQIGNIAILPDAETEGQANTLIRRGESWLVTHSEHTAGIYRFFAMLTQASRQQSEQALCWWETGAMCERRYQVNDQWHNLRPDALAEYQVGQQRIRFWLEWDRGTMNVRDLAIKFAAYTQYITSREWARERSHLPLLLCVTPDIAQERRIVRVSQTLLLHVSGLALWTTTAEQLDEFGPLGPIWRQLSGANRGTKPVEVPTRQCVFDPSSKE